MCQYSVAILKTSASEKVDASLVCCHCREIEFLERCSRPGDHHRTRWWRRCERECVALEGGEGTNETLASDTVYTVSKDPKRCRISRMNQWRDF